jgi:hypothetical protein
MDTVFASCILCFADRAQHVAATPMPHDLAVGEIFHRDDPQSSHPRNVRFCLPAVMRA